MFLRVKAYSHAKQNRSQRNVSSVEHFNDFVNSHVVGSEKEFFCRQGTFLPKLCQRMMNTKQGAEANNGHHGGARSAFR